MPAGSRASRPRTGTMISWPPTAGPLLTISTTVRQIAAASAPPGQAPGPTAVRPSRSTVQ
ncbi:MAG TPA: hypothetical protein DCZ72_09140 [Armatimonadetes bacterium]|nr:hypothetical protein [Armatimonadota bacterium]